ncbi:MAG: GyrI-like domain-containing protein [Planctomycetes bacterium]|nr:GyrI-like domain-containing protein [Planctomycetota bacterium]
MPRISDFATLSVPARPALSLVRTVSPDQLPKSIGQGFAVVSAYLDEVGGECSEVPFIQFTPVPRQQLEIVLYFPLPAPLPGRGEITSTTLPGGREAFCFYLGAYDEITPVYEEMHHWLKEHGYKDPNTSCESYYNGQGFPIEQALTRISMPLIPATGSK